MIDLTSDLYGKITSTFGLRDAPIKGASTNHKGIDIVLRSDSVPAVFGGTVTDSGYNTSMGNYVTVKNADGVKATYMHLQSLSSFVSGSTVDEGDILGKQGSTGFSTGKHLHLGIQKGGQYLDPVSFLSGGSKPIIVNKEMTDPIQNLIDDVVENNKEQLGKAGALIGGVLSREIVFALLVGGVVFLAYKFFMKAFQGTQAIKLVKE